jgi:hypothetical protein
MVDFPWVLSLLIGFLSLSEEILWVRVAGFAYDTLPLSANASAAARKTSTPPLQCCWPPRRW